MVFDVVVHVPIDPAIQWAHVDGATVQPVIRRILNKSCVLCNTQHNHEPMPIDAGQTYEHQWLKTADLPTYDDRRDQDQQIDARRPF